MKNLWIALLAVLLGGAFQLAPAQTMPGAGNPSMAVRYSAMPAELLRQDMRKLWSDHVFWTRDYVIAAIGNQPDEKAAATRLLRNQEDIGNLMAAYYGKAAGDKLTSLLKEHIHIAVDLIKAAKIQDNEKFQQLDRKWDRNSQDIADFLSKANPYWPKATLMDMMSMHLSTTKGEVTARLSSNWEEDVKAFDAVNDHILKMSDALADGIIKQFPERFTKASN